MKEVIVGRIICFSVVLLFVTFPFVSSRLGSCEKDDDCPDFADCKFSFCVCESSYIKIDNFCFRLGNHGDDCFFHEQCNELTMRCGHENQTQWKTCICDKFHEWSESTGACMPHSKMFDYLAERLERKEKLERDVNLVFSGAVAAGIFVFSVAGVCGIVVLGYCIHMQTRDRELEAELKKYQTLKKKRDESKNISKESEDTATASNATSQPPEIRITTEDEEERPENNPNDDMSLPAMMTVLFQGR